MITKNKNLIFAPTFNEKHGISKLVSQVLELYPDSDMLIVDDNSTDGTIEVLESLKKYYSNLIIHIRPKKIGIGSAHVFAFEYALKNGYLRLVTMDADLSHQPFEIQKLLAEYTEANYVVGTRASRKGGSNQSPLFRRILSNGANLFCRLLLNTRLSEYTNSFRCYDRLALDFILSNLPKSNDYSFFIEIKSVRLPESEGKICLLSLGV